MAVENGVHTIEHGNMIDAGAAAAVARHGAVMVPTLSTYEAMDLLGRKMGFPAANLAKNSKVMEAGLKSLEIARDAKVTLGFGTDLIGESQARQRREFAIRAEVETPKEILRSLYVVNAKLCQMEGQIGTLTPGAAADIVLTKVNPLENIAALGADDAIEGVIQAGRPVS